MLRTIFNLILISIFAFSAGARADEVPGLDEIKPGTTDWAVIFIGGAVDSYQVLDKYIDMTKNSNMGVYGFKGNVEPPKSPFNFDYMETNALVLASGLSTLANRNVHHVIVIGACIGGLAATAAVQKTSKQFKSVRLVTLSTPFGGYYISSFADSIPGIRWFTKQIGVAMSAGLSPKSEFMQGLNQKFDANVTSIVIEGIDDAFVIPSTEVSVEQYAKVKSQFKHQYSFQSFGDHMRALDPEKIESDRIDIRELVFANMLK